MMGRRKGIVLFILTNAALLALGLAWGLRGPLAELERVRTAVRLMENRLSIKEQNLANREALQRQWEALAAEAETADDQVILPYDRLGAALDDLRQSARRWSLTEAAFETREPVVYETGEESGRVVEIKTEAVYNGAYADICAFVADVTQPRSGYRVERLTVSIAPAADGISGARLDFYVYAAEADA